jgi:hypothetical protein
MNILSEEDLKGIMVNAGNRQVIICKYGLALFNRYKWSITYANYFLHRQEGGRIIPFHRELLGLHKSNKIIKFRNGNRLDCRLYNLRTIEVKKELGRFPLNNTLQKGYNKYYLSAIS